MERPAKLCAEQQDNKQMQLQEVAEVLQVLGQGS